MGLTGRPPKPIERKRMLGNPGGRPLKGPLTVIAPSEVAVLRLPTDGIRLVETILAGPASAWIGETDQPLLLQLVGLWDEQTRLRAAVDDLPPGWQNGRYQPAVFIRLAIVEKELLTCLSYLGLTPTDRSRLGVAEVKARSKLDALRERRANRSRAG